MVYQKNICKKKKKQEILAQAWLASIFAQSLAWTILPLIKSIYIRTVSGAIDAQLVISMPYQCPFQWEMKHRKIAKSCPEHITLMLRCQVGCFTKRCHYNYYCHYCHYYYNHNLRFWVLSQFDFFSFVTIWVFEFCHNLIF